MELVKSIKQSSRGKGKGIAWQVELATPAIHGSIDSKLYAAVAVDEIINAIRGSWRSGRRVDGRAQNYAPHTRAMRQVQKFVLETDPDYKQYMEFVTTVADPYTGWKDRLANKQKTKRFLYVKEANYPKYKRDLFKRHEARVPSGEIGKKSTKRIYIPNPNHPGIYASGLMVDTLRGKMRNARNATINDKRVVIRQHVELRLPKSRQRQAAWVGGLTQGDVDGITRTFANMPLTETFLRDAIRWQNLEKKATNFFVILRLLRLAARVMA